MTLPVVIFFVVWGLAWFAGFLAGQVIERWKNQAE